MDTSFKPSILLSSEATLNEFNCWSKSFVAHFDSNKDYLAVASNPVKRVFITSLWSSNVKNSGGNQTRNCLGSDFTRPGGNNSNNNQSRNNLGGKHLRGTPYPNHDPNFTCKKCGCHNIGCKSDCIIVLIVVSLDI